MMSTMAVMVGANALLLPMRAACSQWREQGQAGDDDRLNAAAQSERPMRYVDHVLQPGETIRHVTSVSWIDYLPGLFLWLVALVLLIFIAPWSQASAGLALAGWIAVAAAFVVGTVLLIKHWWRRWTTEVAVTDRRIISKTGFINRHTVEMHMDKVESVDVDQSILGRLFNYGDITIRGTGETLERLQRIDRPLDFRNHVTAV
jgi:membrane protein YdbS with pleckstrin-like domain